MVTGTDLFAAQLRLTAGEGLCDEMSGLDSTGHAVECRLYAENPTKKFLPALGTLERFVHPEAIVSLFGCWLAGATWLGLNPRYIRPGMAQILSDSGVGLLMSMARIGNRGMGAELAAHARDLGLEVMWFSDDPATGGLPEPLRKAETLAA